MAEKKHQQSPWVEVRNKVAVFLENKIYPVEPALNSAEAATRKSILATLKQEAKAEGLWAMGHPVEIGGQGMPFLDYVYVNEIIGRSEYGQLVFGTYSLQDSLMLMSYAPLSWRNDYLAPLVSGEIYPSFAMTEPDIASSDPTQLQTRAQLEKGEWLINGRKWFTTGAADATYTVVMCRTELNAAPHQSFSMIMVPTNTPGYKILRDTPLLGMHNGHYEVDYQQVRVPENHLIGQRGEGFLIAQKRLGPGRIFHCMRWLGQAQRAFDLMCRRLHERSAFGGSLAEKQLMQQHVFDSLTEIESCRQLTLHAAQCLDAGDPARVEIGVIKVAGARMLHNVIDRALQVHGAKGLTDDTPLSRMYRHAREARIYDGPDEVHIQSVAKQILRRYETGGPGWEFGRHYLQNPQFM